MAARFRLQKNQLRSLLLEADDWRANLNALCDGGAALIGPLMSFLLLDPVRRLRAAVLLGLVTAKMYEHSPEAGRDIMRRLNWRMSEESGNIGWGVPEAIAEILSRSPKLAGEFHKIFFSSLLDLGFDDNYVDNDTLRRSCYFAIGRFITACPHYGEQVRPLLRKGLEDTDLPCRGYAAWALGALPANLNDAPALRRLAEANTGVVCELTDGDTLLVCTPEELARDTMTGKRRLGLQMAASSSKLSLCMTSG